MDSDSELSSVPPSSPSSSSQLVVEEPPHEPTPQPPTPPPAKTANKKSKKQPPKISTGSASRRSSRVIESQSHPNSPEKSTSALPATPAEPTSSTGGKILLKFRYPSPEKPPDSTAPVTSTAEDEVLAEPRTTSGKAAKRKEATGRPNAEDEFREKVGSKRPKTSHPPPETPSDLDPEKPTLASKKGTVVKRQGQTNNETLTETLRDMFSDDDDEDDEPPEAGPSTSVDQSEVVAEPRTKPTEQKKVKKGSKARRGSDEFINDEPPAPAEEPILAIAPDRTSKKGKKGTKARRGSDEFINDEPTAEESILAVAPEKTSIAGTKKSKKAKRESDEQYEPAPKPVKKKSTLDTPSADQDPPTQTVRKAKSFAQAVTGTAGPETTQPSVATPSASTSTPAPAPAPTVVKKEKKPLPTIPKLSKLANSGPNTNTTPNANANASSSSTPQSGDKKPPVTVPGAGAGVKKGTPAPPKKQAPAPSLLESTMKTLLSANANASTPQKKEEAKGTPVAKAKPYVKGEWTDEWILTPSEQRDVLESKAEREAARAKRLAYRKNPVNLQEAKDAYRLDATLPRVINCPPDGGMIPLGIKTEGAPSKMLAALHAQWGLAPMGRNE